MNKCLELRTRSVLFSLAEIFGALESVNLFPQEIEPSQMLARENLWKSVNPEVFDNQYRRTENYYRILSTILSP
jgi:hypothetical protein